MKKPVLFLSLLLIASSIFGIILTSEFRDNLTDRLVELLGKNQLTVTTQTAEILKTRMTNLEERLNLIVQIPEVASDNASNCNQKLAELFDNMQSKVDNLARIDSRGVITCAVNQKIVGTSALLDRPHIKQIFDDPKHQPVLSSVFIAPGANKNAISVVVPISAAGKFSGTLNGTIYLNELDNKYLSDITLSGFGFPLILDQKGNFLYHPQEEFIGKSFFSQDFQKQIGKDPNLNALVKNTGTEQSGTLRVKFDGEPQLITYVIKEVFPNTNWLIISTATVNNLRNTIFDAGLNSVFFSITILLSLIMFFIPFVYWLFIIKSINQSKKEIQNEALLEPEDTITGQTGFYKTIMDLKKLRNVVLRQEIEIDKLRDKSKK